MRATGELERGQGGAGVDAKPVVHATLILNPSAGHQLKASKMLNAVLALLASHGWLVRTEITTGPGAATSLAYAAVQRRDDVVIVAGGDGTINEAIQALAGTSVALGVLPVGTVNVWAREIGMPLNAVEAAAALVAGTHCRVDLGQADGRYFLLMTGVGFDGAVTGLVEPHHKRAMGRWAYVLAAARLALRYGGIEATVEMDHEVVQGRLLLAVIGNTRLYAGRLFFTSHAIADDGMLDVVLFPGRKPWEAIPRLIAMIMRRPVLGASLLYYRTQSLRITAAEPLHVQMDGDHIGTTPMNFSLIASALTVIVPPQQHSPLFSKRPRNDGSAL